MRKQVLLSIIVPVYNTSEFLDRCIESVLTQTYENLEMILVNDGSTDGSEQILQKYAEIDDRIKIVNCDQNNGLFQARLRGYEQAKGQYICSLDSDDFVGRDYYRSMLQAAQESKAEIVISNMTTYYQKSGERFHRSLGNYAIRDIALNSQEEIRKAYFGMDAEISQWWFVWNKIYRREIWDRCYDILSQYTGHHIMLEDFVYGSVFMTNAKSVYSTEENNYFYVRHENASTGSGGGVKKLYKNINDIVDAFEFLDRYFEGKHYEKEGKEFVRKAAKRWKKTWGASVEKANIEDTDKKELKEILNRIRVPDEAKLDQFEDIWKGYFYRETTQYNPLREKIKNKILDNKTKVVCIQIPDVMCLDVLNDNQIEELLLANWEKTYKIQLGSILQMRRKYLEYFSEEGITHKSETNATEYFTDNLMSDDLKQLENELRTKYSYLNEALIDIYQFTINIGKPIAFVNTSHRKYSDFTERFGKENVFNAFDYQSDIFEIIVEKYLCEEDEVLYIGNGKRPTKRYLDEKHISFIKVEDKDEIFAKESVATLYKKNIFYNSKSVIDYPIRIYFEKELYSDSIVKYGERFLREEIRKGIVDFIHEYLCLFADCLEQILPYFSSMDSLEYDYFVSYPKSADRLLFDIVSMIDIEKKSKPRRLLSNIWWSKLDENQLLPEKKKKKAEEKNTAKKKHTYQMNPYATYYKCKEYQLDKFNSLERIMLYYIYDKDLLTYKLHKYAWSRHTLLPILHLFRKTEKKDRGCLYIATSNYNLLCCMIHKELYHKNDPCDLALSIWRKDKVSGLKAEKFFENIYIMDNNHFRNMTWQLDKEIEGKSKAETDYLVEGFYDRFYEELPVRILRYRHIVATNTIMPITVLLQKLHLPYDTDVNFVLSATELFKIKDLDLILCSEGSVIVFPITGQRVPQNQKVEMCIPDMLRLSLASRNTGLKKKVVSAPLLLECNGVSEWTVEYSADYSGFVRVQQNSLDHL